MKRRSTSPSTVNRNQAPSGVASAAAPPSGSTTRRSASFKAEGSNCTETSSSISSITGTPARGPHSRE